MSQSISLKTEFELPADAPSYRRFLNNGLTITTEAICLGHARRLTCDIETALETGATPAAHALMIERINEANRTGVPLAFRLDYNG